MKAINWLTTLSRVKQHLNKSNTTNDAYLESLISIASADVESYTNRQLRVRTYGVNGLDAEYHNGDGSNKLYARQYPIMSVTSIHDDTDRDFTSTTLKTAIEYMVWKDEGIIQLLNDAVNGSKFSIGIANLQLKYTAGYGSIEILAEVNDRLKFYDTTISTTGIVTIAPGIYTPVDLASAIQAGILAITSETGHTFLYDEQTSKFIFTMGTGTGLGLFWIIGSAPTIQDRSIGRTIGFDVTSNNTSATTYTSDFSVLAIPSDLEMACIQLVIRYWKEGTLGADRMDITSKMSSAGGGTTQITYGTRDLPISVQRILSNYIRPVAYV
jgi:hypothetical protein